MLEKSPKRGERRWRSAHVFLRRLKRDQLDHGRNWSPLSYSVRLGLSPGFENHPMAHTTLCPCFYDPKAQARFKDTPTGHKSDRAIEKRWEREVLTVSDKRRLPVDREQYGAGRKVRSGTHPVRISCMTCGYLFEIRQIENGDYLWRSETRNLRETCPNCKKKKGLRPV